MRLRFALVYGPQKPHVMILGVLDVPDICIEGWCKQFGPVLKFQNHNFSPYPIAIALTPIPNHAGQPSTAIETRVETVAHCVYITAGGRGCRHAVMCATVGAMLDGKQETCVSTGLGY